MIPPPEIGRVIGGRYLVSVADGQWVVSDMEDHLRTVGRHMSFEAAKGQARKLYPQNGAEAPSPKEGWVPQPAPPTQKEEKKHVIVSSTASQSFKHQHVQPLRKAIHVPLPGGVGYSTRDFGGQRHGGAHGS